jgi:arylsulfatase A-like enzyme
MAPVSYMLCFALPGALLMLLYWRWRDRRLAWAATFLLASATADNLLLVMFGSRLHSSARLVLAASIAWQLTRIIAFRPQVGRWLLRRTLLPLAVLVLALGVGLAGWRWVRERTALAALPPVSAESPNVLVIVLDAVRAPIMSLYGYSWPTTPVLNQLAERSIVFDRAIAPSSWTLPSHATMFTGRWPHEVGVGWLRPLDRRIPTIAEAFQRNGYVTGAFTGNFYYTTRETGLDHGFIRFKARASSFRQIVLCSMLGQRLDRWLGGYGIAERKSDRKQPAEVSGSFLDWIDQREDRPFFAFLNYFAAHKPYLSTPELRQRFGRRGVEGRYAAAVAYLDAELGNLFAQLEQKQLLSNTIVVVTSDHGEHLGELGRNGHGGNLYMPVLHVPLLLHLPGSPARMRVKNPVSLRDLPTTLTELANLKSDAFQGASLSRYWSGKGETSTHPIFSQVRPATKDPQPFGAAPLYSLVDQRLHYIRNADGTEELYDYRRDPFESANLAGADSLTTALARFRALLPRMVPSVVERVSR